MCTVEYADDLVLLPEEEMVLLGMIDRLIEIGRWYGMEVNVEKTKISRQPTSVWSTVDQKQVENVEFLNFWGSMITRDEMKSRISHGKSSIQQEDSFH